MFGTNPALLIVHHLRKPRDGDKNRGRSMAYLVAGSYAINTWARAVLTLQPATDAEDDPHVVLTVAKCNDRLNASAFGVAKNQWWILFRSG